jgi:hypothetical protein
MRGNGYPSLHLLVLVADGRQFVGIPTAAALFAFALPEK